MNPISYQAHPDTDHSHLLKHRVAGGNVAREAVASHTSVPVHSEINRVLLIIEVQWLSFLKG